MEILNYIMDNWETGLGIATIITELVLRWVPTSKNRSLIDLAVKVIGFIIKNRRKPQPTDEVQGTKNKVWVDVTKHIIPVLFLFMSINVIGQVNSTFKSARSYNADSTTVRTEVQNLQNLYGDIGALYYNKQSSKWRIFTDSTWQDLLGGSGGGGGSYTAGSGLTLDGTEFKLGGAMTEDININGSFGFSIDAGDAVAYVGYNQVSFATDITGSFSVNSAGTNVNIDNAGINITGPSLDIGLAEYASIIADDGISFLNNTSYLNIAGAAGVTLADRGAQFLTMDDNGVNLLSNFGSLNFNSTGTLLTGLTQSETGYYVSIDPDTGTLGYGTDTGITNTAVNTELAKSDGINLISSGVFIPSNGNITLGSTASAATSHTIATESSGSLSSLILAPKGNAPVIASLNGSNQFNVYNRDSNNKGLYLNPGTNTLGSARNSTSTSTTFFVRSDNANANNSNGEHIGILAGNGLGFGNGGNITITAGESNSNNGGNININSGNSIATGVDGNISINSGTGEALLTGTNSIDILNNFINLVSTGSINTQAQNTFSIDTQVDILLGSDDIVITAGENSGGNVTISSNNGFVVMDQLPVNCTGAPTGALWNDSGTLKICP